MKFSITNNIGPNKIIVPSTLLIDAPNAKFMRFGNTLREAELSEWEFCSDTKTWFLRAESTGDGQGEFYPMCSVSVYGQFLLNDNETIVTIEAQEPKRLSVESKDVLYPPIDSIVDIKASDFFLKMDFDCWHERWVSYLDIPYRSNVFYSASHSKTNGIDGKGCIWTDDSRWAIDAPETPNSILVLLVYYNSYTINGLIGKISLNHGLKL